MNGLAIFFRVSFRLVLLLGIGQGGALAALEWETQRGYEQAALKVAASGRTGFTRLDPDRTGIAFTNHLAQERYTTNQIYLNGSGVAAGDVDGDGRCDLYFCGLDGPNALYRNLGDWQFEEVAEQAGVACPEIASTGAVLADLDGDRDLDLVLNSVGDGTHSFLNDGRGTFRSLTGENPLNPGKGGMSMALADVDGDSDLDMYVANYRRETIRDKLSVDFKARMIDGEPTIIGIKGEPPDPEEYAARFTLMPNGQIIEHGEVDVLYLNDGDGHWTPQSFTLGRFLDETGQPLDDPPHDWGLSVMFRDVNGDGAPDIYVCNDFRSEDKFWINQGAGRFQAVPRPALRTTSMFSMGVDFADLDRDGADEFFVADMLSREHRRRHVHMGDQVRSGDRPQYSRNTLYYNRGDLTYAEIGQFSGVHASDWSWTPLFLDVDLDGYEDLLVSTGHELYGLHADVSNRIEAIRNRRKMTLREQLRLSRLFPRLALKNAAFRSQGDLTFQDAGEEWGFDDPGVSHGMALADLDNDGDLDLVTNNMNETAGIYRNVTDAPRIAVRLRGRPPNTQGIGARIGLSGGAVAQSQEMIAGGRYLSADQCQRVFAAKSTDRELTLEVKWPDGSRSSVLNAMPNHIYRIEQPEVRPETRNLAGLERAGEIEQTPVFEDVSEQINHEHRDQPYNDFQRQPMLPKQLSQLGPGTAWFDLNRDGWDDLLIGSGRGGQLAVYFNTGDGGFELKRNPPFDQPVTRDQTAVIGYHTASGGAVVLAGSSNYEDGLELGPVAKEYRVKERRVSDRLPGQASATGPLALADLDADGDLDLFVGGRVLPGRYPAPASSLLFHNENGEWKADPENTDKLEKVGLVSDAIWSDLDGDGYSDLVLACEWGPIRIFQNQNGVLHEATREWGMAEYRGWWNSVASRDVNGDGRVDLIAGNWGGNNRYQHEGAEQLRLYYGDWNEDDPLEVLEAYYDRKMEQVVPFRGWRSVGGALPFMRSRFDSFAAYGAASVEEILGDRYARAAELRIDTLASMVFLNRSGSFEARPLPMQAQWSPVFGIAVGDYNGDGDQDLFLAQNFFGTNPDFPRLDASRGLWLQGDGQGGFTPVPGRRSGVKVYGEQRGCAVSDYDRDGRLDLVIAQNSGATRLYRNIGGKPGLRVQLRAGPGNPDGIGAAIRPVHGRRFGSLHEVQAGSGYGSQSSATKIVAGVGEGAPDEIWVRWPGGDVTRKPVPENAKEIEIQRGGEIKVIQSGAAGR